MIPRTDMSDRGDTPRRRGRANGGAWLQRLAAALGVRAREPQGRYTARSSDGPRSRARPGTARRRPTGSQAHPHTNTVPYAVVLLLIVGALGGFGYLALSWALGGGPQPSGGSTTSSLVAPAPAPAPPTPVASPSPSPSPLRSYVVKQGDTPGEIARQFGVTSDALLQANNIQDPRALQVGQRLAIPPPR